MLRGGEGGGLYVVSADNCVGWVYVSEEDLYAVSADNDVIVIASEE